MNADERSKRILDAIRALPEREQAVILGLYGPERYSYRVLAAKLGTSSRSIQRWRDDARETLTAVLGPDADALLNVESPEAYEPIAPPARPAPKIVSWATCRTCGRERVRLDENGLCEDICGPVHMETKAATFGGRSRNRAVAYQ